MTEVPSTIYKIEVSSQTPRGSTVGLRSPEPHKLYDRYCMCTHFKRIVPLPTNYQGVRDRQKVKNHRSTKQVLRK